MAENTLHYVKFVTALIDRGIWAQMSSAARTLYPVLLRFTDRNYKPVYPGTQTLLRLTGFKQKASLRRARKELVDLGLVSITEGTGRKNTCYHFRFDGLLSDSPTGSSNNPPADHTIAPGISSDPRGKWSDSPPEGSAAAPPYNQIHISIDNNVHGQEKTNPPVDDTARRIDFLRSRYGDSDVDAAFSECHLGGILPTPENLEQLLYGKREYKRNASGWKDMETYLREKISAHSLEHIRRSFMTEEGGVLIFSDDLPPHLKRIIKQLNTNVFFEPMVESDSRINFEQRETGRIRQFWL